MSAYPPTDLLAEAAALVRVLDDPTLMQTVDLGPLLTGSWEHRTCWQSMARVYMRSGVLNEADWLMAWRRDLCERECSRQTWAGHSRHEFWEDGRCRAKLMWWSLERSRDAERGHGSDEHGVLTCDWKGCERAYVHPSHTKPLSYWLERLERVAAARVLISHAQDIAERAWRLDVEGARRVAGSMGSRSIERAVIEV